MSNLTPFKEIDVRQVNRLNDTRTCPRLRLLHYVGIIRECSAHTFHDGRITVRGGEGAHLVEIVKLDGLLRLVCALSHLYSKDIHVHTDKIRQ